MTEINRSSNGDARGGACATDKKPYEVPQILMVEQLEAVAVDCSTGGKEVTGTGPCNFGNS